MITIVATGAIAAPMCHLWCGLERVYRVTWLFNLGVCLGIILNGVILISALRGVRHTTLITAWLWSLFALLLWALTWVTDRVGGALSAAAADHAWYACAVFSLCPLIAVLGSRRPGARVWGWFILFPMLLVLGWPVGSLLLQSSELRGLHLENPQVAAFSLVLIMGIGNYCGTRYTLSAILYGASVFGIVMSLAVISPGFLLDRSATRFWCSCMMIVAIWMTGASNRPQPNSKLDQIWFDFFDDFGIVWGRRIQDRVNHQLRQEAIPVQLELDGFASVPTIGDHVLESSQSHQPRTAFFDQDPHAPRIEHILRWLLRRFVDPPWINQRLAPQSHADVSALSVDS